MPYTYDTRYDRALFAEDASPAAGAGDGATISAPPRSVGVDIQCHDGRHFPTGTLTTGPGGWITEQELEEPRVVAITASGDASIYSAEWIALRGHGERSITVPSPHAVDIALLLPGDWTVDETGRRMHWTGTEWEAL